MFLSEFYAPLLVKPPSHQPFICFNFNLQIPFSDADNNPPASKYIEIKRKDQKTQSKAEVSADELDKEDPDRCDTPIDLVGWYRSTGLVSPEDKDRFELSNK